jgi:hypothetical protein
MKRDMDLIRELLLRIEAGEDSFKPQPRETSRPETREEAWAALEEAEEKLREHLKLLQERGLIEAVHYLDGEVLVDRLTWEGHDFLESVRDPEIWRKTKSGVQRVGNASIEFVWEIAKAYGKHVVKEKLGLDI